MLNKKSFVFALTILGFVSFLLPTSSQAKKKEYPNCAHQPTVAVDSFQTENVFVGWSEFATNARELVVDELTNSGCYKVVERGGAGVGTGYDREQFLKATGQARQGQKSAKSGNVTLASRLVQFAITGATANSVGGSLGGFGVGHGGFGLGAVSPKGTNLQMTCRVYDSSTSEVLASTKVSKTKVDVGALGAGGGNVALGGDFFYKNPVGKTVAAMVHDCAVDLTQRTQNIPSLQ